jgi:predicted site-specific integrase-resolvase
MTRADVPAVMTRRETAAFLRTSGSTLKRWEREGKLIPSRLGGKVFYEGKDVVAFFNSGKGRRPPLLADVLRRHSQASCWTR